MLQFFVTLNTLLTNRIERDDKGATMVEYGLMVALVAVIAAVGAGILGIAVDGLFTTVAGQL